MATSRFGHAPASSANTTLASASVALASLLLNPCATRALAQAAPCTPPSGLPAPTSASKVDDKVSNPATGCETVVTALVKDPAGTPTADAVAFVRTADDWFFLVKSVGDLVYNQEIKDTAGKPLALTVVSIDATAHTAVLDATPATVDDRDDASLELWMPKTRYEEVFAGQASPDPIPVEPVFDDPNSSTGVAVVKRGAFNGNGSWGIFFVPPSRGSDGGNADATTVITSRNVITPTSGVLNKGIDAGSIGGTGGTGGSSYVSFWSGEAGGNGGAPGAVTVTNTYPFTVSATGDGMHGIHAYSIGGTAGNGGAGYAAPGGGRGGKASSGGVVTVTNYGSVLSHGEGAYGIYGLSVSGNGGTGGSQWGIGGIGGEGGDGGNGANVTIQNLRTDVNGIWKLASIETHGLRAHGIVAQSIGGTGGDAGKAWNLIVSLPESGDDGGGGGAVTVANAGTIHTFGAQSRGIFAQSVGGGGGTGSSTGGLFAFGGAGAGGGIAGTVHVTNADTGSITTDEIESDAIFAQSASGSGGAGGSTSGGISSIGGRGATAGNGNDVTIENFGTIATNKEKSRGIVAQSIGGGGGDGGSASGVVAVGGGGGGGGTGGTVTIVHGGDIATKGEDSSAIFAQSVGGGGGNGGSAGSVGLFAGVAIGGAGAPGSAGGEVNVTLQGRSATQESTIETSGRRSFGVFAQSVGGGGGNGGGALQTSVGFGAAASISLGGDGGTGGIGKTVMLSPGTGGLASITTHGEDSTALFLQSVGGGGGNGGYAISVAAAAGPAAAGAFSLAIGGDGAIGGNGGEVRIGTFTPATTTTPAVLLGSGFDGSITTEGPRSTGLLAQSVGGGGGNGGTAISGALSASLGGSGSVAVGIGGKGESGGTGGAVTVDTGAKILTKGENSTGLLVQSVGGGGGNGGGSIAATVAAGGVAAIGVSASIGGDAGAGSTGGHVELITEAGSSVETRGMNSNAIVAQSVGGGGGNGGYSVSASLSAGGVGAGSVSVGLGGAGGTGGHGGIVEATLRSDVLTLETNSTGVLVQSVGGGGGNGGFNLSLGAAAGGAGSGAVSVGLGGGGGSAGNGFGVTATSHGEIETRMANSSGLVVQSVGGGGGNGGMNVSGALSIAGAGGGAVSVGLGGVGGAGGLGGAVVAKNYGEVTTYGNRSTGVLAQSIGGGGGNGGFNVDVALSGAGAGGGAVGVGLGGTGGAGSNASTVELTVESDVTTRGAGSSAIVAQSIGGGGGNGGFNVTVTGSAAGAGSGTVGVGLGGSGAGGGNGALVDSYVEGLVRALGDDSTGVLAQSVGGGGGNGAMNVSAALNASGGAGGSLAFGLGGGGGTGGAAGAVYSTIVGDVHTGALDERGVVLGGRGSTGVVVQSIGGGGGSGGLNVSGAVSATAGTGGSIGIGLGGAGGDGGGAALVDSDITGDVTTVGDAARGIVVQSIGGGGGNGGTNVTLGATLSGGAGGTVTVGLGGSGGDGGGAGTATGKLTGDVATLGIGSTAFTVQSIGGGGGTGGIDIALGLVASSSGAGNLGIGLGGAGGVASGGVKAKGTLLGDATTLGAGSHGMLVQSVGGGGGSGGTNVTGGATLNGGGSGALAIGLGGFGGAGGAGGEVEGYLTGDVRTWGANSNGVLLQSVGGGGGDGGTNVSGGLTMSAGGGGSLSIGLGGFGGDGGQASTVHGELAGTVTTAGADSTGVLAQSVGGGGGSGGTNVSGTLRLSTSSSNAASIGLGGWGGDASRGEKVTLERTGATQTTGARSDGIVAQSIGGGGGHGGLNVSTVIAGSLGNDAFSASLGLGGFGGGGGAGGVVEATIDGDVLASGLATDEWVLKDGVSVRERTGGSHGVIAQSLGGAGGIGGLNVSSSITVDVGPGHSNSLNLGVGGFGGDGGGADRVTLKIGLDEPKGGTTTPVAAPSATTPHAPYEIRATGDDRYGVAAQSIGGGGGAGGINVSGGISVDGQVTLGVGGFGGDGGSGGVVDATVKANVTAAGARAIGFLAQSVGGGGGAGGINVSGGLQAWKSDRPSLVAGLGGFGGTGNTAGTVTASHIGSITVDGADSIGVLAQSIGGGGGAGGLNVSGNAAFGRSYTAAIGVGGHGGTGGDAGEVTLHSDGVVHVDGRELAAPGETPDDRGAIAQGYRDRANGILVQSIGGGGGTGGMNFTGVLTLDGNPFAAGVGGTGGAAGDAGDVHVFRGQAAAAELATLGDGASGLVAQSIGGGGGDAGYNFVVEGTAAEMEKKQSVVAVGGSGGAAGEAGAVDVTHTGTITTAGAHSDALLAQSIGGGGGNATVNFGTGANRNTMGIDVIVGGSPEGGGAGKLVTVVHSGTIGTLGADSSAIFAQSIGGGGGDAVIDDKSLLGRLLPAPQVVIDVFSGEEKSTNLKIGRRGGTGGVGGDVVVTSSGTLSTQGTRASAIVAQSIGNGGGDSDTSSGEISGSMKVGVQVGLEGGEGGHSGKATVTASGSIETAGWKSDAIFAQSVGGGGGTGGSVSSALLQTDNSLSIGVGGNGGKGNWADLVTVTNSAALTTHGREAHGIHAESLGGGGGDGGFAGIDQSAVIDAATSLIGSLWKKGETDKKAATKLSSLVGGTGGEGGMGGEVVVTNHGTIETYGERSYGITAKSTGGGGGSGGMVVAGSIATEGSSNSLSVNVGGDGGEGNVADDVSVTSDGTIHTRGVDAVGIAAVSEGGGGGDAGLMATLSIAGLRDKSTSTALGVNVGGKGGKANAGGSVVVTNVTAKDGSGGTILTEGDRAYGVFAQSLGGGGGNGSTILSASFEGGQDSFELGVNVGGKGGTGGKSAAVTVTNGGLIETRGTDADAIKAQSIGGGGGNGGLVIAANAGFATSSGLSTPLVTLGGSGGNGNDAGSVLVVNTGRIVTRGANSDGIVAESIGGGGGNAGLGLGFSNHAGSTAVAGVLSGLLGGSGGSGGIGGSVTVHHSGDITVLGRGSQAVSAQSIDGGGGGIALDFEGITRLPGGGGLPFPVEGKSVDPVFVLNLGGDKVGQSNPGKVMLDYTGTFGAAGDGGAGNAAQAIGGGGGTFALTLGLREAAAVAAATARATTGDDDLRDRAHDATRALADGGQATDGTAASVLERAMADAAGAPIAVNARLGGTNGTGNLGGTIESRHAGDLVTEGLNTPGLLLQSIGGGGGRANVDVTTDLGELGASSFALGGANGSGESGGHVTHTQTGSLYTSGATSHAGIVQSIGGGGGALGFVLRAPTDATISAPMSVELGSSAGNGLAGGAVDLSFAGAIATRGALASGLVVQSIGGGGGLATLSEATALDVALGGTTNAAGDGGTIALAHTGTVTTTGARSHGLFVQSIGGGGGAVFTALARPGVTARGQNLGDGGAIALTQSGDVVTTGAGSYGLFVQSLGGGGGYVDGGFAGTAGGDGRGGTIALTIDGDVLAMAAGSTAVFAQSAGGNGGGDVDVALAAGRTLYAGAGGVALRVDGGATNVFTNAGTVATADAVAGFAMRGGVGDDSVDNRGTIVGSVDLGAGWNAFRNRAGATFASGGVVSLGVPTALLQQEGTFAPFDVGAIGTTALSGSFRQAAGATTLIDLDVHSGAADSLRATGTTTLAGTARIELQQIPTIQPGQHSFALFTGAAGVTNEGLMLNTRPSLVITYGLRTTQTAADLDYAVTFAPRGLEGQRTAIGEYLDRVQLAGSSARLADTIVSLVAETRLDAYSDALTQIGTEFYADQQAYALADAHQFLRTLRDCGIGAAPLRREQGRCTWAQIGVESTSHDAAAGFPGSERTVRRYAQGLHRELDDGRSYGLSLELGDGGVHGHAGDWRSDETVLQAGMMGRQSYGRTSVGLTLAASNDDHRVRRVQALAGGGEVQGNRSVRTVSLAVDVTHRLDLAGVTLTPSLAFGATGLHGTSMRETGPGLAAALAGRTEMHVWAAPSIDAGIEHVTANRSTLRAYARLGARGYLTNGTTELASTLVDAPAAAPLVLTSDVDRWQGSAEAGVEYVAGNRYAVGLSYAARKSNGWDGAQGALRIVFPLK